MTPGWLAAKRRAHPAGDSSGLVARIHVSVASGTQLRSERFRGAALVRASQPVLAWRRFSPPLYKSDRDASFTSAFMSLYIVETIVAYTLVVLLVA